MAAPGACAARRPRPFEGISDSSSRLSLKKAMEQFGEVRDASRSALRTEDVGSGGSPRVSAQNRSRKGAIRERNRSRRRWVGAVVPLPTLGLECLMVFVRLSRSLFGASERAVS